MGLILKISAGVIIGLLAFQAIFFKFIDYNAKNQEDKMHLVKEMKNRVMVLMISVKSYYQENNTLAESLSDLKCIRYKQCDFYKRESIFYIKFKNEWMLIEPYITESGVEFPCKGTFLDKKEKIGVSIIVLKLVNLTFLLSLKII